MIGNVPDIIRSLRKEAGLSQERLGDLIGIGRGQICTYERQRVCPSIYRFEDILDVCGYELVIRKKGTKEE